MKTKKQKNIKTQEQLFSCLGAKRRMFSCFVDDQRGQALIALIALMFIAITIITAGVVLAITQTQSSYTQKESTKIYDLAEAGAENAILYLERHPNFTGGLSSGISNVTIEISGTDPKIIISTAEVGNTIKKIQVTASVTNNVVTVTSWQEL